MQVARQSFTRETPDFRRQSLIEATARCLAKHGAQGISVRAICAEAGVSPGLLRHYFTGINDAIAEAYHWTGSRVETALAHAVAMAGPDPRVRLLAYLTANFRSPVSDPDLLATWLGFWGLARTDAAIGAVHDEVYAASRQSIEALIKACPNAPQNPQLAAVAMVALVDGLWLELSLGNAPFSVDDANTLVEQWLDALLD